MLIETQCGGFNPMKALGSKRQSAPTEKYIKNQFYKMQTHHHQHALLHRNALQQTCNNEGWHSFTDYLSFQLPEFHDPGVPRNPTKLKSESIFLILLQYGTRTNVFLGSLIHLLFCSDKQIT